jgi:hypothetical protein
MTLVKNSLLQFALDAQASLFTVQAFAAGIVAVVAHSPKFAIRAFHRNCLVRSRFVGAHFVQEIERVNFNGKLNAGLFNRTARD